MHLGYASHSLRSRTTWIALALAAAALAALGAGIPGAPRSVAVCKADLPVSDADMQAMSAAWFRAVPLRGNAVAATTVAADTFLVTNYQFNADHNAATQVDVVHISPGQSVLFKWVSGIHTTTSGNPSDADAGSLWNYPIDGTHTSFSVTFPDPGTYPFFCAYHGAILNMVGTVVVDGATPTRPSSWGAVKARYR